MKEIEIIEVPASEQDKFLIKFYQEELGKTYPKYYIGFESDPTHKHSVLFEDLKWIRKHFGVDKNESSPITHESLNEGRSNELARYQQCLDLNVPLWAVYNYWNYDEDRWMTLKEINETREGDKKLTKKPNIPKLSEQGQEQFQNYIDNGLLVLCKLVDI